MHIRPDKVKELQVVISIIEAGMLSVDVAIMNCTLMEQNGT